MMVGSSVSLAVIIVAQLFGTSLWFAANSAADELTLRWALQPADWGTLTNAVQAGFITGTLGLALLGLPDRYPASRIFAISAVVGALANAAFALLATGLTTGASLRFVVGLSMAGVYPLGMKLVVSWRPHAVGSALAALVGMLTLGIALPHGLRWIGAGGSSGANANTTMLTASGLAVLAAALVAGLGDGPHLPRSNAPLPSGPRWGVVLTVWRLPAFRASALGYFGHQWELYAFWTLVPLLLVQAGIAAPGSVEVSAGSFAVIGMGAVACMVGGLWSRRLGSARVAAFALAGSALCCAAYPWLIDRISPAWMLTWLLAWGGLAVMDSPHFSALSARACPPAQVGSALTLQNAIGFLITMVSIQWANAVVAAWGPAVAWLLLPGPVLGLWGLAPLWRRRLPGSAVGCSS